MNASRTGEDLFPCPFCGSGDVRLIGGTETFLYQRCDACREIWTAVRSEGADDHDDPPPRRRRKPLSITFH